MSLWKWVGLGLSLPGGGATGVEAETEISSISPFAHPGDHKTHVTWCTGNLLSVASLSFLHSPRESSHPFLPPPHKLHHFSPLPPQGGAVGA